MILSSHQPPRVASAAAVVELQLPLVDCLNTSSSATARVPSTQATARRLRRRCSSWRRRPPPRPRRACRPARRWSYRWSGRCKPANRKGHNERETQAAKERPSSRERAREQGLMGAVIIPCGRGKDSVANECRSQVKKSLTVGWTARHKSHKSAARGHYSGRRGAANAHRRPRRAVRGEAMRRWTAWCVAGGAPAKKDVDRR